MGTPGTAVALSGNPLIDGLLSGDKWAGSTPTLNWALADNPLQGFSWSDAASSAAVIAADLSVYSSVANINFNYVGHYSDFRTAPADIVLSFSDSTILGSATYALTLFPDPTFVDTYVLPGLAPDGLNRTTWPQPEGDVFFNVNYSNIFVNPTAGSVGFWVALHELGHALGLKHPHDNGPPDVGNPTFAQLGIANLDTGTETVMSYNEPSPYPSTLMPLDILALQYMYGANMSTNSGDTTYVAQPNTVSTIWDGGGTDTIDLSALPVGGVTFNLTPGSVNQINNGSVLAIAYGCTIENLRGTAGNDTLIGNDANNVINFDAGFDTIDGGGGVNTAAFDQPRSEAQITFNNGSVIVGGLLPGVATLTHVQYLQFADETIKVPYPAASFDGNGTSDFLFQNSDGQAAIWLLNGLSPTFASRVSANPGTTWHLEGAGDFDDDGKADILWQNADGQAAIWLMNATTPTSGLRVDGNPGSSWRVAGIGDFNGDGTADILWQNADGQAAIWLMSGTAVLSAARVGANPGSAWHVVGAGDFNGDGRADILWQNDDGQAAVWLLNGITVTGAARVGSNPGSAWRIAGVGDFDGDGRSDILWQNSDGQAAIWLMNGTTPVSAARVGGDPGSDWRAAGAGDFNGDGKSDILWQNSDGQAAIWLVNDTTVTSAARVGGNPGTDWHLVAAPGI